MSFLSISPEFVTSVAAGESGGTGGLWYAAGGLGGAGGTATRGA